MSKAFHVEPLSPKPAGWPKPMPGTSHVGPLATPVEYALHVRRYAPFQSFGGGFHGDGRGFSTSPSATSRTIGVATFGPASGGTVGAVGSSSGSSWVGPWELRKSFPSGSIGTHAGKVRVSVSNVKTNPGGLSFTFYTEGNLPFKEVLLHKSLADGVDKVDKFIRPNSPRVQGTPDIDTFVDFTAKFAAGQIEFLGTVRGDGFPNAEVFVMDANQVSMPLFDYRTKSNSAGPLYRLFGRHATNRLGTFRGRVEINPDGSFKLATNPSPTIVVES